MVCNVNIVYENLKSEISQDYAQEPQRNFTFMNSASEVTGMNSALTDLVKHSQDLSITNPNKSKAFRDRNETLQLV
jgi:hypothetical protein